MHKLLTLIITAAIIYMIFQHNINNIEPTNTLKSKIQNQETQVQDPNSEFTEALGGNFVEKTISNVLVNVLKTDEGKMFFENILTPSNNPVAGSGMGFKINNDNMLESMFHIKTFGEGKIGPASCGHVVTVHYKILSPNNATISQNTLTYPLGSNQIAPGVDAVIVGMKTGQTRHAMISSRYTDNKPGQLGVNNNPQIFKLNVVLKEITPPNFVDQNVKIFDDEIAYKTPLLCGKKAIYNAKITKLSDGSILYDSKKSGDKINMHIGNLTYPLIFSYALHNKIPIGTRTVIARGRLFKSFISEYSAILPKTTLPEEEFFMLELYDFEDNISQESSRLPKTQ